MKISELVEALERLNEEQGDLEVEFQHCDSGGDYPGSEEVHDVQAVESDEGKVVLVF